jgi:hypothetical protein
MGTYSVVPDAPLVKFVLPLEKGPTRPPSDRGVTRSTFRRAAVRRKDDRALTRHTTQRALSRCSPNRFDLKLMPLPRSAIYTNEHAPPLVSQKDSFVCLARLEAIVLMRARSPHKVSNHPPDQPQRPSPTQ